MDERALDEALGDRLYIQVCPSTHRPQNTVVVGGGGTVGGVCVPDGGYSSLYLEGDVRPTTPSVLATMVEGLHPAADVAGPYQLSPFPLDTPSGLQAALSGTPSCSAL